MHYNISARVRSFINVLIIRICVFFWSQKTEVWRHNTELVLFGIKLLRITNFLVTILTGQRLIPFRTQKLSPLRPMVVLTGESRLLPGIIKADTEGCRPFPLRWYFKAALEFLSLSLSRSELLSKITSRPPSIDIAVMKAALIWVGIGSLLRFLIVGRENVKETPDANRTVKLSPLRPMAVLLVRE